MAATSPRSTASSTRAGLPPKTTRTNLKKIKRPSNAFFIYRRMLAKKCRGIAATDLSRIIGKLWKDEPPKVKAYFARLAQQESDMHAIAFPNYKFTPVQRGLGKRGRQLAAIQAARASGDPLPLPPPPVGHRIKPETSKNIECLLRNVRERILPGDFLDGEPKDSPPEILPPSWRVNGIDNTGSTSSSKSSSRTNTRSNRGRSRGIQADSTTQSKMTGRKQDGYITINDSSSLLTVKIKKEEDTEYQVKSRGKNKNGFSSSCSPAEAAEEPELKCLAKREPRSPSCSSTSSLSSCGSDAFLSSSEDEEDEMDLGDDAKDEDYVPSARQRQRYHKRTVHNTTTTTTTTTTGQSTRRDYHVSRCSRAAFMPMTPMSPESECEPDSAPVPCATEPSHQSQDSPVHPYNHLSVMVVPSMESLGRNSGVLSDISVTLSTAPLSTMPPSLSSSLSSSPSSCASVPMSCTSLLLSPATTVHSSSDDLSDCGSAFSLEESHHNQNNQHHHHPVASNPFQYQTALDTFEPECLASHPKIHWESLHYMPPASSPLASMAMATMAKTTATTMGMSATLQPTVTFTYTSASDPSTTITSCVPLPSGESNQEILAMEFQMASMDILADSGLMSPDVFNSLAMN